MIKMWLDDVRPAPVGWTHVHDYEEAIALMKQLQSEGRGIEVAQLDHDLGGQAYNYCPTCRAKVTSYEEWQEIFIHGCEHGPKVGRCVVEWMERHNFWPSRIIIHSFNHEGAARMQEIAEKHTDSRIIPYTGLEI